MSGYVILIVWAWLIARSRTLTSKLLRFTFCIAAVWNAWLQASLTVMDTTITRYGVPDMPDTAVENRGLETDARGCSSTVRTGSGQAAGNMQSSLLKSRAGGHGYDFSGSFEQTRRVRFKFGGHSLAVEATLAKLFESLTVECRQV